VEVLLPEHKVTSLDTQEEMRPRTEQREREAAERNYTKLRRQQTGRGLTIALAIPDDANVPRAEKPRLGMPVDDPTDDQGCMSIDVRSWLAKACCTLDNASYIL
jgi:hypothetical protein